MGSRTRASSLADRVTAGDARAIARAISLVENEDPQASALIGAIFGRTGRAWLVGVTGPPGAGKSTLVDRLVAEIRRRGQTVGVIAVDPSSPFTGGAILGDRVRMQAHAGDAGVFIRSMATRGHLGGLARATGDAALVLDAAGMEVILIETVGVGQDEVEIARNADLSIVVLIPGTGDDVQALKAGIMEIADIFVVNKADREGADRMVATLEALVALGRAGGARAAPPEPAGSAPAPPILKTQATSGAGVADLLAAIDRARNDPRPVRQARRRARSAARLRELLRDRFMGYIEADVLGPGEFDAIVEQISTGALDPYSAANAIMARALGGSS